ncbi:MAG: hypothetical protein C7B46_09540 [Sulfobacillus benefaciens]|uniref:Segregation/condensation protein A n=1 Tax=Sulfobacillus benefaciens TaxID=453960 RepID=A0A2T2XG91_9FIRM|nr:MAG: hypothetical protein C7B46_09540 [Sulfobacillus benefaciens]
MVEIATINDLAERVRRHPDMVLSIEVLGLVRHYQARWREAQDLLDVTDEVPVTAWVVRRKSDMLLPRPADPEPEVFDASESEDSALWLSWAVAELQARFQAATQTHRRPPTITPNRVTAVKDASPWKLAWSWPKVKPLANRPVQIIPPEQDPIGERLRRIRALLQEVSEPIALTALVDSHMPRETVLTFSAIVQLWHQDEIAVSQNAPFQQVWIVRNTHHDA